MLFRSISTVAIGTLLSINVSAQDSHTTLVDKKLGNTSVASVVVDNAPGNVSAMSLLGLSSDQVSVVENPRGLTLAAKAIDGKNALGLSFTPARTSLLPMSIQQYRRSAIARVWASTTFSYAQGQATANGQSFDRRAISIETSHFLQPEKDDPLTLYWIALEAAGKIPDETKRKADPCFLHPEASEPVAGASGELETDSEAHAEISKRSQMCRDKIAKQSRWNASRVWGSVATGQYQPADGGRSRSLGQTLVLGITYGLGERRDATMGAVTVAFKAVADSPTLETLANASPVLRNSTIGTLRLAFGSETMRLLLEGSNVRNEAPTTGDRSYKAALGLDLRVSDDFWLNFRLGTQRRIDNTDDETGSSILLSYSPKALLKF